MKNQAFPQRLRFACAGILDAFLGEASFRTQVLLGAAALVGLMFLRPPPVWFALCVLCAAAVLALELLNTSLEHLADRLHPERHESIQRAKDCAAGAVLIASLTAVIIGGCTVAVCLGWLPR
jgi:undecaprenol kinase